MHWFIDAADRAENEKCHLLATVNHKKYHNAREKIWTPHRATKDVKWKIVDEGEN